MIRPKGNATDRVLHGQIPQRVTQAALTAYKKVTAREFGTVACSRNPRRSKKTPPVAGKKYLDFLNR
jgi:hypothetical protein